MIIKLSIIDGPIEAHKFQDLFSSEAHGALSVFFGRVRTPNAGKEVIGVSYEVFAPLFRSELERICQQAETHWGYQSEFAVWHAKGYLTPGQVSVVVGAACVHRAESFEACRFLIEELKAKAPIWKQEHYQDGKSDWVQGHALCGHH